MLNSFDIVICHNVLEYVSNPIEIFNEITKFLKPNGILSIVKHNLKSSILAQAVFSDDPAGALSLLNSQSDNRNNLFGKRGTYGCKTANDVAPWFNFGAQADAGARIAIPVTKD